MKVIVGLGNPGAEYASTPHSVGFEVVDQLARDLGADWRPSASFKCEIASGTLGSVKVLLVKPMTYMNSSGDSVAPVVRYHNADAESDLTVVSDDIDLPLGRLRIRKGGSAGGHNGLKSVIERTGTCGFVRLRVGVGRREGVGGGGVIGHVLGKFDPVSRRTVDEVVPAAADALKTIVNESIETAMNRYNGWTASAAEAGAGKENP